VQFSQDDVQATHDYKTIFLVVLAEVLATVLVEVLVEEAFDEYY
jgi:hypothetical protein